MNRLHRTGCKVNIDRAKTGRLVQPVEACLTSADAHIKQYRTSYDSGSEGLDKIPVVREALCTAKIQQTQPQTKEDVDRMEHLPFFTAWRWFWSRGAACLTVVAALFP